MSCPHRAAQTAVAADRRKPQPMRAGARNAQRICSANRGQRDESVTPSSRTGSGRRRHSQAAPSTADTRNAQRICSANRGQRSESVSPLSRAGSGRRRQTQAAVNATSAAPDHGQRDESVSPSSRAGVHKPQSMNATSARNAQRICSANRGQRSESAPPSSRAGVRFPPPLTREKQPLKRGPHAGAAFCAPFNIFTRYNGFAARLFVASSGALSQKALI